MEQERTKEQIYDEEIAPVLLALGEKIKKLDMSMVAVVEYAPSERGATKVIGKDSGLEMKMLSICDQTAPNVDGFMLALKRYCYQNNIDVSSSMYLSDWGNKSR